MDEKILTRGGVAYDFTVSPFRKVVRYGELHELTFVFSSERNLEKFNSKLEEHREKINYSLSRRFGISIKCNKLSDIKLYSMIENRGFLIKGKDDYTCLSIIELDGHNLTIKN